jgi:hypothetical protein
MNDNDTETTEEFEDLYLTSFDLAFFEDLASTVDSEEIGTYRGVFVSNPYDGSDPDAQGGGVYRGV